MMVIRVYRGKTNGLNARRVLQDLKQLHFITGYKLDPEKYTKRLTEILSEEDIEKYNNFEKVNIDISKLNFMELEHHY